MKWNIVKEWGSQPCFIVGGGWSLKTVNISVLSGKNIIAVNTAFKLADFIHLCWFGDKRWYEWNEASLASASYLSKVISCHPHFQNHPKVYHVLRSSGCGIDTTPNKVLWNYCSGFSAINFAYHLGAKTIVLLGFDMRENPNKDEGNNYHKEHQVKSRTVHNPYLSYLRAVEPIAQDASRLGLTILNTTKESAIPEKMIPKITLEEALCL